jgi:SAM-dependent methyltransferase
MESIHSTQSKKWFSGKEVELYPTAAPVGEAYKVYSDTLREACKGAKGSFAVLELGCGTGRYFYFLDNVTKLTGMDISADMLKSAKTNIEKNLPQLVPVTDFVTSGIEDFDTTSKYDFIYSIGTLGEYCVFNKPVLDKILAFLKPGGFFFFTIVDAESFRNDEYVGLRKRIFRKILKVLPRSMRSRFDARALVIADWKDLFMTKDQVESVIKSAALPVRFELTKAKDSLHVHHICKVWRTDA